MPANNCGQITARCQNLHRSSQAARSTPCGGVREVAPNIPAMITPPFIRETDRWLGRAPSGTVRPLITLNSRPGAMPDGMAEELRDYLTSVDDESPEGWRAFETQDLLELVTHPLQSLGGRALAPADGCTGCACPGDDCGTRKKYKAAVTLVRQMARHGGAVIAMPGSCRATRDFGHAFHVWLECSREHRLHRLARWHGWDMEEAETELTDISRRQEDWLQSAFGPRTEGCSLYCHLTLNIDQMGSGPLITIIGDTVLEWAASRDRAVRQKAALHAHDMRDESQSVPSRGTDRVLLFPQQKSARLL